MELTRDAHDIKMCHDPDPSSFHQGQSHHQQLAFYYM